MKKIIIITIWLCCSMAGRAQCLANNHRLIGPFQLNTCGNLDNTNYKEEDLCSWDGYVLAFEDNFNGPGLDMSVWEKAYCNPGPEQVCSPDLTWSTGSQ